MLEGRFSLNTEAFSNFRDHIHMRYWLYVRWNTLGLSISLGRAAQIGNVFEDRPLSCV